MRCVRLAVNWLLLFILTSLALQATVTHGVRAQDCDNVSSGLRSVDDYIHEENPGRVHTLPELGIEISNGTGRLETGAVLRGAKVIRVIPEGPAARAGLKSERNIGKEILTGALIAGGLVFPPVLFAALAVGESDIGDSHDTIIAADSQRTSNVQQLERAVDKSRQGPILYLTVVRGGRRNQIQVCLCAGSDQSE
ncbi:MAG: PDZ domain-containing protein [Candidatus Binataceae bacterium]